jgi:hypothetical protein
LEDWIKKQDTAVCSMQEMYSNGKHKPKYEGSEKCILSKSNPKTSKSSYTEYIPVKHWKLIALPHPAWRSTQNGSKTLI